MHTYIVEFSYADKVMAVTVNANTRMDAMQIVCGTAPGCVVLSCVQMLN